MLVTWELIAYAKVTNLGIISHQNKDSLNLHAVLLKRTESLPHMQSKLKLGTRLMPKLSLIVFAMTREQLSLNKCPTCLIETF